MVTPPEAPSRRSRELGILRDRGASLLGMIPKPSGFLVGSILVLVALFASLGESPAGGQPPLHTAISGELRVRYVPHPDEIVWGSDSTNNPFVVPSGRTLIVTDFAWRDSNVLVVDEGLRTRFARNTANSSVHFTHGIPFRAGEAVDVRSSSTWWYGYLVAR